MESVVRGATLASTSSTNDPSTSETSRMLKLSLFPYRFPYEIESTEQFRDCKRKREIREVDGEIYKVTGRKRERK